MRASAEPTPSAFLAEVRARYADGSLASEYAGGVKDPAFAAIIRAEVEAQGLDPSQFSRPDALDGIVRSLAQELATVLTSEERRSVRKRVAFGGIDHSDVNAACYKSADNLFAIVVHYGLMMFLHKFTKLTFAAQFPDRVTYCNRASPTDLAGADYTQLSSEVVAHCRKTGQVAGPTVRFDPELNRLTALHVKLAETFVIAHEIGHFICGHLDDDSNFQRVGGAPGIRTFAENVSHQQEFEADEVEVLFKCRIKSTL